MVHLPLAFTMIGIFSKSLPSHFENGSKRCNLLLLGSMRTLTSSELLRGAMKIPSGLIKPSSGTSGAGLGGSSLNLVPSDAIRSSFSGLNESLPPKAKAIIISGLPIKLRVFLLPSFRPGKFLLNVVTIVFC